MAMSNIGIIMMQLSMGDELREHHPDSEPGEGAGHFWCLPLQRAKLRYQLGEQRVQERTGTNSCRDIVPLL